MRCGCGVVLALFPYILKGHTHIQASRDGLEVQTAANLKCITCISVERNLTAWISHLNNNKKRIVQLNKTGILCKFGTVVGPC